MDNSVYRCRNDIVSEFNRMSETELTAWIAIFMYDQSVNRGMSKEFSYIQSIEIINKRNEPLKDK